MPYSQPSSYILKRIVFFILFCNFSILFAQSDSLARKSYQELDSLYLKYRYNNPKKAKLYANEFYTKVQGTNDDKKIGEALFRKAFIAYKLAEDDSAFSYIHKSFDIGKKINNDSLLLRNICLKGNIYLAQGNFSKATDEYIEAKKIAKRMGNPKDILRLDHNIGLIKKDAKDFYEAIDIFLANLEFIKQHEELDLEELEIISLLALSDTYLKIENIQKAEEFVSVGLQKSSLEKFKEKYLLFSVQEVTILHLKKQYESSIQKGKPLLKILLEHGNEKYLVTLYFYLGKSFYEIEKCDRVKYYFEKIITLIEEEYVELSELKEVYHILGICEAKAGNAEKSTEYHKLSAQFDKKNDSINTAINNEIHKKYDIVPLKEEIESLDDYGKQQKNRAVLWFSIAAIAIISLFIFFFLQRKKQQQTQKRFHELLKTIEALEQAKTEPQLEKTTTSVITDENVLEILKGLKIFEEKEYYLRQDCTLVFVAKKLKTNTSYLSNVINTYKEKSFKSYLTELRINAALIRLKNDSKLRAYTIKAIAEEFGYKRQETFSKAFKARTNMLPSNYIKSLKNNNIEN